MVCKRTAVCCDGGYQVREDGEGVCIEGFFAVFDGTYPMWDGAYETVDPDAFSETLGDDIRALVNHDTTLVLGRTTANTLELSAQAHGLWGRIKINRSDQDAMNLYERVKRGDVTQCSFGFDILDEEQIQHGSQTEFRLKKVKLYEVSVVTFPAYEDTAVNARKADFVEKQKKQTEMWRATMSGKLKGKGE